MGVWNKEEKSYLMGLEHALELVKHGDRGVELLDHEVKARLGGMRLPAGIDRCTVTELARAEIKPELTIMSVAMAWALEKGLKLPSSRIAIYLDSFNERIDLYRYDREALATDMRILDQSWCGADMAGKKYMEIYEERVKKAKEARNNE